jgi:uncharacterized protein
VKWTPGTENKDVIDQRGKRVSAAKLTIGTVAVAVIVVVVTRLIGVDISGFLRKPDPPPVGSGSGSDQSQPPVDDPDKELVDFIKFVMKDIQDTFETKFQADGKTYRRAKLVLFTDAVDTGCGRSSSAIGPFYCPLDEHAYIDLSFYRDLKKRFGAPGDFAQSYVLAHEIGHHLQKLAGTDQRAQALGAGHSRNEASVRVELQADCFAGAWGHEAQNRKLLEEGDLEEAITAAQAIGDDRLQKQAGREVNPETFTHGTSAQRMQWFRRGFESGRFDACDTFSAGPL